MFEKFTERARKVMSISRQEAQRLNCDMIGPEHILLGIIAQGGGVASKVFKLMDVNPGALKAQIEKSITIPSSETHTLGQIPFTPRSKRVIELAGECASQMNQDVIGTEHLLMGLIKENESVASMVLSQHGFKIDAVAKTITALHNDSHDSVFTKKLEVNGTIIDLFTAPHYTITILDRQGSKTTVNLGLCGIDSSEVMIGRRIQVKIETQVKFLD